MLRSSLLMLCSWILLSSCAATYHKNGTPHYVDYSDVKFSEQGLRVIYNRNLLRYNNNRRYYKLGEKKGLNLIELNITNKSGRDLIFDQDIVCFSEGKEKRIVRYSEVKKVYKQKLWPYAFYLLFSLPFPSWDGSRVYIVSPGAAIGGGNMSYAAIQNSQFRKEYQTFSLEGKVIKNNQTVYGWVVYEDIGYSELEFVIQEKGKNVLLEK